MKLGVWYSWTVTMGFLKKGGKTMNLYYYIKVFNVKPVYQLMTLLVLGVVEISTLWHFRLPLLIQKLIPQTIRDWNAHPDSLISSAEDAGDCVAKFTSLVRARDKFPNHRSWWLIVISTFHQSTILILILILILSNTYYFVFFLR